MNITEKLAAAVGRLQGRTTAIVGAEVEASELVAHGGLTGRYTPRAAAQWLPFEDLTACEQARRVGEHVQRYMAERHYSTWELAEAAETQQYAPRPQDISDLLHGLRHLRGAAEVRALADALGVRPNALLEPGWPA